jgi:hypothetical protein
MTRVDNSEISYWLIDLHKKQNCSICNNKIKSIKPKSTNSSLKVPPILAQ